MFSMPLLIVLIGPLQEAPPHPTIPANPLAADAADAYRMRFVRGVAEAEAFRSGLLEQDLGGRSQAYRIGEAIERFRAGAEGPLSGRPGLRAFEIGPEAFEARIRGERTDPIDAERVFGAFAGRWYGVWDQIQVDHDWSAVESLDPGVPLPGVGDLRVRSVQSAWIGDGFGWNVIASPRIDRTVILGTVYHVEPGRPDRVRLHRPHVGVEAGAGLLIWVTGSEVFLEEIFTAASAEGSRYAITGFRYELGNGEIEFKGPAFQAVYTRDSDNRPAWYSFSIQGGESSPPGRRSDGDFR